MKRFLTLMTAIMMVLTAMAQSSGIVLSYNKGKELKFYGANELHKAIDDAEINDTIYFGSGEFDISYLPEYNDWVYGYDYSCVRQITKPLTFIGAGGHTNGGTLLKECDILVLNIKSSLDHSKKIISFEGLNLSEGKCCITPTSDLNELKLINTKCSYFDKKGSEQKSGVIDRLIIDRSNLQELWLNKFTTKSVIVNNSKIKQDITGGCDSNYGIATFDHCLIASLGSGFIGAIKYSIIKYIYAGQKTTLEDCWYYGNDGNPDMNNCHKYDAAITNFNNLDDDPSSLGKCNDETVYGTLGGKTPFTLYPQYPTPDTSVDSTTGKSKSYVDYDALNKKLTITVKRLGE